jgi:antitoxin ParD1/3/4
MVTMHISLPDELKDFVDHRIQTDGFGTTSEYVRSLIRLDKDRQQFRQFLLEGIRSDVTGDMDAAYFQALRQSHPSSTST